MVDDGRLVVFEGLRRVCHTASHPSHFECKGRVTVVMPKAVEFGRVSECLHRFVNQGVMVRQWLELIVVFDPVEVVTGLDEGRLENFAGHVSALRVSYDPTECRLDKELLFHKQ